ncbi:MAG: hypothetical protein HC848_10460 [Limnobacter sp.]|nr:hypothetical protein [Limnobacter sp.]
MVILDEPRHHSTWTTLYDTLKQTCKRRFYVSVCPPSPHGQQVWYVGHTYLGEASHIKISVQLANRKGALTSIEFSDVLGKVRRFVEEYSGHLEFPEMKASWPAQKHSTRPLPLWIHCWACTACCPKKWMKP